jgi:hypothetical protein
MDAEDARSSRPLLRKTHYLEQHTDNNNDNNTTGT